MALWAWCNFDEATIFIALVILRVLFTEPILVFTSFSEGMTTYIENLFLLPLLQLYL